MSGHEFYGRTGLLTARQVAVDFECDSDSGYQLVSVRLDGHERLDDLSALDEQAIYEELDQHFAELTEDVLEQSR